VSLFLWTLLLIPDLNIDVTVDIPALSYGALSLLPCSSRFIQRSVAFIFSNLNFIHLSVSGSVGCTEKQINVLLVVSLSTSAL
jgi:hypothetical protein